MSNKYLDIAMEKVIKQEVNAVLEQIRAEQKALITKNSTSDYSNGVMNCLNVIDKYR